MKKKALKLRRLARLTIICLLTAWPVCSGAMHIGAPNKATLWNGVSHTGATGEELPVRSAPLKMKALFVSMPDSLIPMLIQNARKDLVDIAESGMTSALDNEWGGRSRILELEDDYLMLLEDIADSITVEMALLPGGKDTLLALIRTIPLPQKDSEIFFYTTGWKQLKPKSPLPWADLQMSSALWLRFVHRAGQPVSVEAVAQPLDGLSDPLGRPAPRSAKTLYQWRGKRFVKQQE